MSVDILSEALERMPAVQLAVVFGSEAGGTARAGSDIDLGLLLDAGPMQVSHLAVELERLVGRPIHIVLLDQASPLLRSEVSRHGKLLVERQPYAFADFRARAMIDWWDWAPTAALIRRVVAARLREETANGAS